MSDKLTPTELLAWQLGWTKSYVEYKISKEDREALAQMLKKKKLRTSTIERKLKNAWIMESALDELQKKDPKIAEEVKEFWYPLRFKNLDWRWAEEIKVRLGKPTHWKEESIFAGYETQDGNYEEHVTREEAERTAKRRGGEYLEKSVVHHHQIKVRYTIEELREKWKTKGKST